MDHPYDGFPNRAIPFRWRTTSFANWTSLAQKIRKTRETRKTRKFSANTTPSENQHAKVQKLRNLHIEIKTFTQKLHTHLDPLLPVLVEITTLNR